MACSVVEACQRQLPKYGSTFMPLVVRVDRNVDMHSQNTLSFTKRPEGKTINCNACRQQASPPKICVLE